MREIKGYKSVESELKKEISVKNDYSQKYIMQSKLRENMLMG
jgi:hypothetical protein